MGNNLNLLPPRTRAQLTACGIVPVHVTAPELFQRDWSGTQTRVIPAEHRFTLFANRDYPGPMVTIGSYKVREGLFQFNANILPQFIKPESTPSEILDLLDQNPVYEMADFDYILDHMRQQVLDAGHQAAMTGVLVVYILRLVSYATSHDLAAVYTIAELLEFITRGYSPDNVRLAALKKVPAQAILDNPGVPLNLMLEMY